jgi:ribosomal protein L14
MCVYSAKKERNNNVGKTIVLTISYKEKKAKRKKKDIVICVLVCMEYGRQLDTYISHDDIRLNLIIFEKFIDIIIIKLKILNQ